MTRPLLVVFGWVKASGVSSCYSYGVFFRLHWKTRRDLAHSDVPLYYSVIIVHKSLIDIITVIIPNNNHNYTDFNLLPVHIKKIMMLMLHHRLTNSLSLFWLRRIRADGPYCHSQCPELDACINESLWCDGVEHCPSGYDESFGYCMHLLYTHLVYSIALIVAIVIVAVSSGLTVLWFRRFRSGSAGASSGAAAAMAGCRGSSAKSTETEAMVAACDVVYWHKVNDVVHYVEYDRVTTVWWPGGARGPATVGRKRCACPCHRRAAEMRAIPPSVNEP